MNNSSVLSDFLQFLSRPKQAFLTSQTNSNQGKSISRFWQTVQITAVGLVLALFLGFVINISIILMNLGEQTENLVLQQIEAENILTMFLTVAILGPFLEELAYRLFFSNNKSFFLIGSFFFILINTLTAFGIFGGEPLFYFVAGSILIAGLLIVTFLVKSNFFVKLINQNFNWFLYLNSAIFALIHLSNYPNLKMYWLAPFLVLPQLLAGLVFAFVRIRFGFFYSFFSHSLYNLCNLFPLIVFTLVLGSTNFSVFFDLLDNIAEGQELQSLLSSNQLPIFIAGTVVVALYTLLTLSIVFYTLLKFAQDKQKFKV